MIKFISDGYLLCLGHTCQRFQCGQMVANCSVVITHTRDLKMVKWYLAGYWGSGMARGGILSCPTACSVVIIHTRDLKVVKWYLAGCGGSDMEG